MRPKRLVADAMLGSLARKLRAFGFDTLYCARGGDREIVALARSTRRVLVTADRGLAASSRKKHVTALLVGGDTDSRRIGSMLAEARAKGVRLQPGDPLCSVCNGPLTPVARAEAAGRAPPPVAKAHRQFMECGRCHKLYWKGTHWKKLRRLRRRFLSEPRLKG